MSYMSSMIRNGMTNLMRDMWIRMVSDNYTRSDFAMYPIIQKIGLRALVESNLRATDGEVLDRPLGSPIVSSIQATSRQQGYNRYFCYYWKECKEAP